MNTRYQIEAAVAEELPDMPMRDRGLLARRIHMRLSHSKTMPQDDDGCHAYVAAVKRLAHEHGPRTIHNRTLSGSDVPHVVAKALQVLAAMIYSEGWRKGKESSNGVREGAATQDAQR